MPHSAFNDPILLPGGELVVTGPVVIASSPLVLLVPPITFRFLIVQKLKGRAAVVVDDEASWAAGAVWEKMITADKAAGIALGEVRAVGTAIMRWDAIDPDSPDPPAFETYSWCVTRNVVSAPAAP